MGGATPVYSENDFLEVPLGRSFHSIPFWMELWTVGRMQSYLPTVQIVFHPPEILTSK